MDEIQVIEKEQLTEEEIVIVENQMQEAMLEQQKSNKKLFIWLDEIDEEDRNFIKEFIEKEKITEIECIKNSNVDSFISSDDFKFMDKSYRYVLEDFTEEQQVAEACKDADYIILTDKKDVSKLDDFRDKLIFRRKD